MKHDIPTWRELRDISLVPFMAILLAVNDVWFIWLGPWYWWVVAALYALAALLGVLLKVLSGVIPIDNQYTKPE